MDVTPSCTRQSYSVLGVTIRALAQNSWFTGLKFNRNCFSRWDSYYSLTCTKWVSLWSFPKPRCICSVAGTATLTCRHLELQCPTHIPAGQNFLPASALDSCQPCQKLVFEMDLQLGRQGHCFYTHMDLLNAKEMFLNWWEKIPWHNYSFRSFPKTFGDRAGESTWLKEVKICSWWSEWDRLSAGMTADDGVIKHLP